MCTKYDVMHPFYDPHARVMKCATGTLGPWLLLPVKDYLCTIHPHFMAKDSCAGMLAADVNCIYVDSSIMYYLH